MRTTIDLPDDLHRIATTLAHDRRQTLSEAVSELMRRGLSGDVGAGVEIVDGWPIVHIDRPITTDDVRSLDDDE